MANLKTIKSTKKKKTVAKKKNKKVAGLLDGTTEQKILRLEQLLTQPHVTPGAIQKLRQSILVDKGKA